MEQKLTLRIKKKKKKTTWALTGPALKNLWKLEMKVILPIPPYVSFAAGCVCVLLCWALGTYLAQAGGWILLAALCREGALLCLSWLERRGSQGCVWDAGLVAWETGTLIHLMWLGRAVQPSSFILPWAVLNQLQTGHCSFVCLCSLSGILVFHALQSQLAFCWKNPSHEQGQ